VQIGTGADVRRERTDAPHELFRGASEVEHPVGRLDLVRVGDAVPLLWPGRWSRICEHAVEQPDRDGGCPCEHRAGVVAGLDREGLDREDRTGVELLHRLVDGDAGLGVTGNDRALDGRSAAPARQKRRMDVEPLPLTEELLFRGTLLRSLLRKITPDAAVLVTAAIFGLVHVLGDPSVGTLIALPAIILLGVVSGVQAVKTGTLSRSILLHMGFNALSVVLLFAT